jgi:hypothetical protein
MVTLRAYSERVLGRLRPHAEANGAPLPTVFLRNDFTPAGTAYQVNARRIGTGCRYPPLRVGPRRPERRMLGWSVHSTNLTQQLARRRGAEMAGHNARVGQPAGRAESEWAGGFTTFAGIMMIIIGVFHAAAGLAGIIENEFYVVTPGYLYSFDATSWGWIHLLLGIVVAAAGFAVFARQLWARAVGIVLAALSAVANFLFLPYAPVWSVLIIALDVFVIWALIVHGRTSRA